MLAEAAEVVVEKARLAFLCWMEQRERQCQLRAQAQCDRATRLQPVRDEIIADNLGICV